MAQTVLQATRRADKRFTSPIFLVRVGGREFITRNWSYSGLLLMNDRMVFREGSLVVAEIIPDIGEPPVSVKCTVVRSSRKQGLLALRFVGDAKNIHALFDRVLRTKFNVGVG